jgi:MFS family permease
MPITRMLMINIGHGLDHLLMLLFPVVAALAANAFDEDYSVLLALSTGSWLAFGLGSMPAGWLADRWSRRGMLAVFFIGSGAACLLTAVAQNYWQIAGALALLGVFASIYHPVGVAILAGGAAETLGKRLAINGVWGNVGVAFSAVVAGALADRLGWQAAFIVPGVVSIGLGVLWLILVPAGTVEDGAGGPAKPAIEPPVDWKRVIIIIACLTVLTGFAFNAAIVSVPKLLDERMGEFASSATAVGFLAFGVYIVAGFAQLLVGGLIDRFPVKPIFLAIAAAEAVAMLLVINAEGMALMIACAGMMALVYAGLPIADTLIGRNAPAHLRSRIYAFTYLISFGASTAAIPVIAYLHGNGDFAMLFAILAWMGVIVFVGVSLLPGHRPATLSPGK